jgi:hypothetical protein
VLRTYLKRIGKIAVFWIVLLTLFKYEAWDFIRWLPRSASELTGFILSGGHTIYYFFVSLLGLTLITHFAKFLNFFQVLVLFILSILFVSVLPIVSIATGYFVLCAYWSPLNFLPYPFAAILVSYIAKLDRTRIKPIYLILSACLILLFCIVDWAIYVNKGFFNVLRFAIPIFARPSLVLMAMMSLFLALKINLKRNPVILFMSNNSLALYCIHPFFLPLKRLSGGHMAVSLFLVVLFSYLTALIMKHFIRQELIK